MNILAFSVWFRSDNDIKVEESGPQIEYTNGVDTGNKHVSILSNAFKDGDDAKLKNILVNDAVFELYKDSILIKNGTSKGSRIECNPLDEFGSGTLTIEQHVIGDKDSGVYLFLGEDKYVKWINAHYLEEPTTSTEQPTITDEPTEFIDSTEITIEEPTDFADSTANSEEVIEAINMKLIIGLSFGVLLLLLLLSSCVSIRYWRKKVKQRREEDANVKRMEAYKQQKIMEMTSKPEDKNAKDKPSVLSMNESTQTANQEQAHLSAKSSLDSNILTSDVKVLQTFESIEMEVDDNVAECYWGVTKFSQIFELQAQKCGKWFEFENDVGAHFALYVNCETHYSVKVGVLVKEIDENKPVFARVEVWIADEDGERIHEHVEEKFEFKYSNQKCEFYTNRDEDAFLQNAHKRRLNFTIGCELTFIEHGTSMVFQKSLTQKLQSLYGETPDVAITISTNGKEFKVPSTALSLHSNVFRQMFTTDSQENLSKKVEINDISAETIEAFIKWMYTGNVCNELIEELYFAADKYLVHDLKLRCSELMIEGLNESNVARRLVTSRTHNDKGFEEGVMEFISEQELNFMGEVFQSQEWHSYLDMQRDAKKLG
ncbi:TD and POZ domain-containing protein 2-like protein [Aphelenchoides bicaudatus]|nr:TD and POZ domain-containing protein 2-like protein [Aphelenchoides bicaudatus]